MLAGNGNDFSPLIYDVYIFADDDDDAMAMKDNEDYDGDDSEHNDNNFCDQCF